MQIIGLRKVWVVKNEGALTYSSLINHLDSQESNYNGFVLNFDNFCLQCINCVMITIISLQSEIFESAGYQKFVRQSNGSMDMLIQLAD
jgi:hypothetical protein